MAAAAAASAVAPSAAAPAVARAGVAAVFGGAGGDGDVSGAAQSQPAIYSPFQLFSGIELLQSAAWDAGGSPRTPLAACLESPTALEAALGALGQPSAGQGASSAGFAGSSLVGTASQQKPQQWQQQADGLAAAEQRLLKVRTPGGCT